MTARRAYLLGLGAVAVGTLALSRALAPADCAATRLALVIALAVQAPLGWWLVRVLGTERFVLVWALGIGARLGLVTLWALLVVPALALPLAPALFALVGVLLTLLAVEVIVVYFGRREPEA